eukprot:TRINITY_DN36486_c0_g1_i1.p1 TRINITY_DN36486_c0_g1~~TRINITY_DN36486_c0_g1_i1.p1  ORF type:complete len:226 (+),score=43.41 TRINITY_DN36486_c0_g1_i1:162-839(+)
MRRCRQSQQQSPRRPSAGGFCLGRQRSGILGVTLAGFVISCCAWRSRNFLTPSSEMVKHSPRRDIVNHLSMALAGSVLSSAAPEAVHADNQWEDKFDGSYQDANYTCERCLRTIDARGGLATIFGRDDDGQELWQNVVAEYNGNNIVADFRPIGGKLLKGKWYRIGRGEDKVNGINWEDGSKWEKQDYKEDASPGEALKLYSKMKAMDKAARAAAAAAEAQEAAR